MASFCLFSNVMVAIITLIIIAIFIIINFIPDHGPETTSYVLIFPYQKIYFGISTYAMEQNLSKYSQGVGQENLARDSFNKRSNHSLENVGLSYTFRSLLHA